MQACPTSRFLLFCFIFLLYRLFRAGARDQCESRGQRRLYHIAAQLERAFRLIDTDSDGLIAQEQVAQVLNRIGIKASQGQLQLLQANLKFIDGKLGVEEFVQLAVLLEGGEGDHMHLEVPSSHVHEARNSPFFTVKTFSNTSQGTQAERVSFSVGRLEIDLESIAISVLRRWKALLGATAVWPAPSAC